MRFTIKKVLRACGKLKKRPSQNPCFYTAKSGIGVPSYKNGSQQSAVSGQQEKRHSVTLASLPIADRHKVDNLFLEKEELGHIIRDFALYLTMQRKTIPASVETDFIRRVVSNTLLFPRNLFYRAVRAVKRHTFMVLTLFETRLTSTQRLHFSVTLCQAFEHVLETPRVKNYPKAFYRRHQLLLP